MSLPFRETRSIPRWLYTHTTRVFEDSRRHSAEDETANVGQVCHATGLNVSHCAGVKQLSKERKADQ